MIAITCTMIILSLSEFLGVLIDPSEFLL